MSETETQQEIVIVRRVQAPRELVWNIWTDPKHVAAWWGPFGPDATTCEIDVRVGGVYCVVMRAPDGSEHPARGIIKELEAFRKIIIEGDPGAPDMCGAGLPPKALITVLFEDEGPDTKVTLSALFQTEEAKNGAIAGGYDVSWTQTFDALDAYYKRILANQ
ncbi:MAG: SRPBCC domain-containing protein [bacterium]|nr:SRPBCC domain-containing protein [bacterium]